MAQILSYIQILLSILLIIGVLLQRSEASLGAAFGGGDAVGNKFSRRGFGMAHSLGNAIHEKREWAAAMILLADMPYLKPETIGAVLDAYNANASKQPIVIPTSQGKTGHPVIFPQRYFAEIQALEGDVGAKPVIDAHPEAVITVEVDDPGIFRDIDTPADL